MKITKEEAAMVVYALNFAYAHRIENDPMLQMLRDISHNISVHYNVGIFDTKPLDK